MSHHVEVRDVECPKCGALPGYPCTDKRRKKHLPAHKHRWIAGSVLPTAFRESFTKTSFVNDHWTTARLYSNAYGNHTIDVSLARSWTNKPLYKFGYYVVQKGWVYSSWLPEAEAIALWTTCCLLGEPTWVKE